MRTGLRRAVRGFTLIEILVACAIMAIMAGVVVLRLDHSDRDRLDRAAESLVRQLEAASADAVVRGQSTAFSSDGVGFQFWLADAERNDWIIMPVSDAMVAKQFDRGVRLESMQINGSSRPLGERLAFSPLGLNEAFTLTLAAGASRVEVSGDALGRFETRHAP